MIPIFVFFDAIGTVCNCTIAASQLHHIVHMLHLVDDERIVVDWQARLSHQINAVPQLGHPNQVPLVDAAIIVLVGILQTHHDLSQTLHRGCAATHDISTRNDMIRIPGKALAHPRKILHT